MLRQQRLAGKGLVEAFEKWAPRIVGAFRADMNRVYYEQTGREMSDYILVQQADKAVRYKQLPSEAEDFRLALAKLVSSQDRNTMRPHRVWAQSPQNDVARWLRSSPCREQGRTLIALFERFPKAGAVAPLHTKEDETGTADHSSEVKRRKGGLTWLIFFVCPFGAGGRLGGTLAALRIRHKRSSFLGLLKRTSPRIESESPRMRNNWLWKGRRSA